MTPNRKKRNFESNHPAMNEACIACNVSIETFNVNSFRLTKFEFETVDYFPASGKYFLHSQKKWGQTEFPKQFIEKHFTKTEQ